MHNHSEVFLAGFSAHRQGKQISDNPHWFDQFKQLWLDGFNFAQSIFNLD